MAAPVAARVNGVRPVVDQLFSLSAVVMLVVAFGLWAETRAWGKALGAPLLLIALAMALSNLGLIPHTSAVYDQIVSLLVPMAIPLLVMRADFRSIFSGSGSMGLAFAVATVATVAGALVGAWVINLGEREGQIVGTVAASYIGGSLNYVATAEAVGLKDSSVYVAGLSADAVGAVIFLLLLMAMPASGLIRRALPSRYMHGAGGSGGGAELAATVEQPAFDLAGAVNGLAISLSVCALSMALANWLNLQSLFILIVTTLALLVANFGKPLVRHVRSDFQLGTLFMYIFFVAIGAGANLADVLGAAWPILQFIIVMVMVHLLLVVLLGRWLKLDLAEVMIASNACILGPAPAAALAASKGWHTLVTPGILVGMLGYAIATFIGVGLAALLS